MDNSMIFKTQKSKLFRFFAWLLTLVLLFFCFYFIQRFIDKSYHQDREERLLYLPSGKFLKPACLGFESLMADLLWIKAISYFGGHYLTDRSYKWLYHILDLVTSLDPLFRYPYEFGGVILSLEGGNPEQSILLLEKGIEHHPEYWRLYFYLGFNYFYYFNDFQNASRYITRAAQLPGHPSYLPRLAASLLTTSGQKNTALSFLRQLYENTEDDWLRHQIKMKMDEILAGKLPESLKGLVKE
ncbi:MAG: tetratricopeptide repeat protein [bacterium]